jgi:SAM-dependent methyltransferase
MMRLPDSGAEVLADGRRLPASAQRNAAPILQVLQGFDLRGSLLEIASGSGLHAGYMAPQLQVDWQPSDVDPGNMASIRAWAQGVTQVRPPLLLDATQPGWHRQMPPQDAVLLVNLLHLIPEAAAATVLAEVAACLAPAGRAFLYGPFLRDGLPTSEGDAAFDASLRAQDPAIGYKDLAWVLDRLAKSGLQTEVRAMPANNLMLIAQTYS